MFADQIFETLDGFRFGDVEFHRRFADVEIHLARRAADVAEIGVGHFARAVHDAAHDGDLHAFEMRGGGFDSRGRGLQIEKRASAAWAGHIIGLENPRPGGLQDVVGKRSDCPGPRRLVASGPLAFALHENGVADSVAKQRADVGRRGEQGGEEIWQPR